MPEISAQVEIPSRALFKAAEVCDLVKVQPYVLRSWEAEFPDLGVAKSEGGPRVYRRADVERVVRIKHLLLVEGLSLAGARRKLEDEATPVVPDGPAMEELMGRHARERLTAVKRGLRSILDLLAAGGGQEFRLSTPPAPASRARPRVVTRAAPSRGKVASPRMRASAARRKRSA